MSSLFTSATKPAKAASYFSLFSLPQNGVVQGSVFLGGGATSDRVVENQNKMDNQPGAVTSNSPQTRPKMLNGLNVSKHLKMENRVPALSLDDELDDGSLPCTPELGSPSYGEDLSSCPSGEDQVLDVETRNLIVVFLRDHTGLSVSRLNRKQSKALSTMKRVVEDVIDKHRLAYNGMVSKLSLDDKGDDMSVVSSVAKQIFNDGKTNWGRIVSLVAFGAVVCQHQMNSGREHCVELVGQEISSYLLSDQRDWMAKNNAWEGFVEFFHVADPESAVRNTLMAFAGVAGIGATLALLIR